MKYIIIIGFIVIAIAKLFQNKIVGMAGEFWVKKELKKLNEEYKIINDVMIKTKDGSTHQIDHIVVSKYGIFVIETKQYNGILIGNDYDRKWIFKSFYGRKYYINNPVHQNYGHIQALKEVLNIEDNNLVEIVCISSRAKLRINSNKVVGLDKLLEKIRFYKNQIINNYEEIYNKITLLNISNKSARKQHVKDAKKNKKTKDKESKNKCPKCGGKLKEIKGKYGTFTGCSNYPNCTYSRK